MARKPLASLNIEKYANLLPPQTSDEKAAIQAGIIQFNGIIHSVTCDEHLNVLDGIMSVRLATELRIRHAEVVVLRGLTEDAKRELRLSLNCARRQLTRDQRGELIDNELRYNPKRHNRTIARILGACHKTVGRRREALEASGAIPHIAKTEGERDGKPYTYFRAGGRVASAKVIARDLEKGGDALKPFFPYQKTELGRAVALKIQADHAKPGPPVEPGAMHTCDFSDLEQVAGIKPESVALLMTDPLYDKKHLWQWEILAALAERWLKTGGVLATWAPIDFLNRVLRDLDTLTYHTQIVCPYPQGRGQRFRRQAPNGQNLSRRVESGYVPILIHSKKRLRLMRVMKGVIPPEEPQKGMAASYYTYQKPVHEAVYVIEHLTRPGDLVVDCFAGSGTVGIACQATRRRCILGDANPDCPQIYARRLRDWLARQEKLKGA